LSAGSGSSDGDPGYPGEKFRRLPAENNENTGTVPVKEKSADTAKQPFFSEIEILLFSKKESAQIGWS